MTESLRPRIEEQLARGVATINDAIQWQLLDNEICDLRSCQNEYDKYSDELQMWQRASESLVGDVLGRYKSALGHAAFLSQSFHGRHVQAPLILISLQLCADWRMLPPSWLHQPVCEQVWAHMIEQSSLNKGSKAKKKPGRHSNPIAAADDMRSAISTFLCHGAATLICKQKGLRLDINQEVADCSNLARNAVRNRVKRAKEFLRLVFNQPEPPADLPTMIVYRVPMQGIQRHVLRRT